MYNTSSFSYEDIFHIITAVCCCVVGYNEPVSTAVVISDEKSIDKNSNLLTARWMLKYFRMSTNKCH